ncbi:MAG: hypothetical protein ACLFSM_07845 [Thermoplasmata archaeon]
MVSSILKDGSGKVFLVFLTVTIVSGLIVVFFLEGTRYNICFMYLFALSFAVTGVTFVFVLFNLISSSSGSWTESEKSERTSAEVDVKRRGKDVSTGEEKGFFQKIFKSKKTCPECGKELEYREEYQSYYCTHCRTYRRIEK